MDPNTPPLENPHLSGTKPGKPVVNAPQMLTVALLYREKVEPDPERILQALKAQAPKAEYHPDEKGLVQMYYFPDTPVQFKDGTVPAQCHLLQPEFVDKDKERFETALQQAWDWLGAAETLRSCKHELLLTDFISTQLPAPRRVEIMRNFLRAVVEVTRPQALFFIQSDKLIPPSAFMESFAGPEPDFLKGLLQIRQYRLPDEERGVLMDTQGMAALGLPDFQVRFQERPANQVAGLLVDYAYYLFENGPIIHDGEEITGLQPGEILKCVERKALAGPDRNTLELLGL